MSTISANRNANRLVEDMVSKDYIDIVYKKAKHTLNVYFRVLVLAIRKVYLISQSLEICISLCHSYLKKTIIYDLEKPIF
jgi:hypothetical protein